MTIEEYAKVKLEIRLKDDVKGMSWEQREKYLSSIASLIDGMLNEEPIQIGLDTPMEDERYFEQHPYDEGFFRT
jgi:hypothetical protein